MTYARADQITGFKHCCMLNGNFDGIMRDDYQHQRKIMKTILVLHGGQASGKSTFAKDLLKKEPGKWKRVNRDSIRLMLDNGEWSPENEKFVIKTRDFLIREGIKRDYNIIVDDMNFSKNFDDISSIAESIGIDIQVVEKHFWVPLDEAIARDKNRENSVGEKVIRETWLKNKLQYAKHYNERKTFFTSKKDEEKYKLIRFNPDNPKVYLCDIDGTCADISHRNPYDLEKCNDDAPIEPVIETVLNLHKQGYRIIFVSGRHDTYREETFAWLKKHFVIDRMPIEFDLFMRKAGDKRADEIVKRKIFDDCVRDKYNVVGIFDDRPKVIRMWRELGLTVFQMNDKEF